MSTIRTASILGFGGSTPNRVGGSPLSTQRQNFRSAVTIRCWWSGSAWVLISTHLPPPVITDKTALLAATKYMPQLQHNMWVVAARTAVLSVITGGGKWVEILAHADPLYQYLIVTAERKFWRCVENGEEPKPFGIEPPKPRIAAVRVVDMTASNAWAEFAGIFAETRSAHLEHERAKTELKGLIPEDAKEASGHGIRAKRSKSGAVSFDLLASTGGEGGSHAAYE